MKAIETQLLDLPSILHILILKRNLTYDDDDDNDSRNKEADSLPGKRSKFDEDKKGTVSLNQYIQYIYEVIYFFI